MQDYGTLIFVIFDVMLLHKYFDCGRKGSLYTCCNTVFALYI